jgi:hypothetical protein
MAQGPGQGAAVQRPRSMASAGDLQQERRRREGGPGAWLKPESWRKVVGRRIARLLHAHAANVYVCCILTVSLPVCRYHRRGNKNGGKKGKNVLKKVVDDFVV